MPVAFGLSGENAPDKESAQAAN